MIKILRYLVPRLIFWLHPSFLKCQHTIPFDLAVQKEYRRKILNILKYCNF